ncbi:Mitochondrial import inner membrane translocase subunit TIM50 [Capsicum chinense]|nr:Mitochondrial import inner membrane translocase subunit TIM50 [Capsicum chinense]
MRQDFLNKSKSKEEDKERIEDLNFPFYAGSGNPYSHLKEYLDKLSVIGQSDSLKTKLFLSSLNGPALMWYAENDTCKWDYSEPSSDKLLLDLHPLEQHVFTIVLDLSETLVYSDWKRERGWRTFKRPGVEAFLEHLAQFFEIIVYSDQQNMYVDPIVDRLDSKQCIRYRLSRGATKYVGGKHYRDLSALNRDPSRIIYISGNALESSLQPENCVQIKPWKGDVEDTTLLDLIPFLEYVGMHRPADIRTVIASYQGHDIAKEFIERSKEHQRWVGCSCMKVLEVEAGLYACPSLIKCIGVCKSRNNTAVFGVARDERGLFPLEIKAIDRKH